MGLSNIFSSIPLPQGILDSKKSRNLRQPFRISSREANIHEDFGRLLEGYFILE